MTRWALIIGGIVVLAYLIRRRKLTEAAARLQSAADYVERTAARTQLTAADFVGTPRGESLVSYNIRTGTGAQI